MKTTIFQFGVLLLILAIGVVTFFFLRENVTGQLATGIVTAVAYFFWGIIHHKEKGDLHAKVVIEYILIAAIAVVILFVVMRS